MQATLAPSLANRIAVAFPFPIPGLIEPAPVTMATLSFSLIFATSQKI